MGVEKAAQVAAAELCYRQPTRHACEHRVADTKAAGMLARCEELVELAGKKLPFGHREIALHGPADRLRADNSFSE